MRRWLAALKNLWRGRAADRDLEAELQSYLDHATDHLMQRGAEVAEARRSAGLELGGVTQVAEAVRDVRAGARVTGWGRD